MWALAGVVIVCAATAVLIVTFQSSIFNSTSPAHKPLRTEQEIAGLKKEQLQLAEELIKEFPGSEDSLVVMGNVWNRYGDAAAALKFWQKAVAMNPNRADVYEIMGWLAIKKGQFEDAIVQYQKALAIQPRLPGAHSNLAHALMILGRLDEAMEALEKEIQISPNSSFAYFLLGQAYLQQKEYEKAKENYEAAIKIDPGYENAYYGLATVCAQLGDSDMAKAYSEKFKKLRAEERKDLRGRKLQYDDFVETQKSAALTYIEAGRMYRDDGKLQKAEELLKRAAGLDPENIISFQELASLYQKQGQLSKTLEMHKKISEIVPDNPICHTNIGIFSLQLKQYDGAEQAFRKVIALAPKRPEGYRELARLYLEMGTKLQQARQLAEKAVELEQVAANYFVLSLACYKNGDTANASSAIKRAVDLEPGNPEYLHLYELIQVRN